MFLLFSAFSGDGACSDAQMYNDSELREAAEDDTIGFPDAEPLPNDTQDVPYFFIGEDVFALRTTMMKPYSHRTLDKEERIFDYRLSRARRVVEKSSCFMSQRHGLFLNHWTVSFSTLGSLMVQSLFSALVLAGFLMIWLACLAWLPVLEILLHQTHSLKMTDYQQG